MCKELNLIDSNYVSFLEFQDKDIVRTHNILDIYPNLKTYKENYPDTPVIKEDIKI